MGRVIWTGVAAAVALLIVVFLTPWQVALLIAWDVGAFLLVVWVLWDTWSLDGTETRKLAKREDDFEASAHVILVLAALVSLVGVGLDLFQASEETGSLKVLITLVAVISVVISWLTVHTVFIIRYARLYYDQNGGVGGGIDFNGEPMPDYRDFGYLALTIGMTYQVSDTGISARPIRRAVLRHAVISYIFGVSVIAVLVNVVAGLLSSK
jgi:uncharacterized membrane protein